MLAYRPVSSVSDMLCRTSYGQFYTLAKLMDVTARRASRHLELCESPGPGMPAVGI